MVFTVAHSHGLRTIMHRLIAQQLELPTQIRLLQAATITLWYPIMPPMKDLMEPNPPGLNDRKVHRHAKHNYSLYVIRIKEIWIELRGQQ